MNRQFIPVAFFMVFILGQKLCCQEIFGDFHGENLFPDLPTIQKYKISQINRDEKRYYIGKDSLELGAQYLDCNYYNALGRLDSVISWSGDSDDSILCIGKGFTFRNELALGETHLYQYYNTFTGGRSDGQWLPSMNESHFYLVDDKSKIKIGLQDSDLVLKIKGDTSKTRSFFKRIIFYDDGLIRKDSTYLINELGIERLEVRYHFYDEKSLPRKVVRNNYNMHGMLTNGAETRYIYSESGGPLTKCDYSTKSKKCEIVRTWAYNKNGTLRREKIKPPKIGVKSRFYRYDTTGKMINIKEKHSDGYVVYYTITYNTFGLLQKIVSRGRFGKFVEVQTFSYLFNRTN